MTNRSCAMRLAPIPPVGALVLAVALAGCGSGGAQASPAWSFAKTADEILAKAVRKRTAISESGH